MASPKTPTWPPPPPPPPAPPTEDAVRRAMQSLLTPTETHAHTLDGTLFAERTRPKGDFAVDGIFFGDDPSVPTRGSPTSKMKRARSSPDLKAANSRWAESYTQPPVAEVAVSEEAAAVGTAPPPRLQRHQTWTQPLLQGVIEPLAVAGDGVEGPDQIVAAAEGLAAAEQESAAGEATADTSGAMVAAGVEGGADNQEQSGEGSTTTLAMAASETLQQLPAAASPKKGKGSPGKTSGSPNSPDRKKARGTGSSARGAAGASRAGKRGAKGAEREADG